MPNTSTFFLATVIAAARLSADCTCGSNSIGSDVPQGDAAAPGIPHHESTDVPPVDTGTMFGAAGATPLPGYSDPTSNDYGRVHLVVSANSSEHDNILAECAPESCKIITPTKFVSPVPHSILLLVDASGSMEEGSAGGICNGCPTDKQRQRVTAAKTFASHLQELSPDSRLAIAQFGEDLQPEANEKWRGTSSTQLLSDFGSRVADHLIAADQLRSHGCTPLRDALVDSIPRLADDARDHGIDPFILVISDGGDTCSVSEIAQVLDLSVQHGVSVNFLTIGRKGVSVETDDGHQRQAGSQEIVYPVEGTRREVVELALSTGGFVVESATDDVVWHASQLVKCLSVGHSILTLEYTHPPNNQEATIKIRAGDASSTTAFFNHLSPSRRSIDDQLEASGSVDTDQDGTPDLFRSSNLSGTTEKQLFGEEILSIKTRFNDGTAEEFIDQDIDGAFDLIRNVRREGSSTIIHDEEDTDRDGTIDSIHIRQAIDGSTTEDVTWGRLTGAGWEFEQWSGPRIRLQANDGCREKPEDAGKPECQKSAQFDQPQRFRATGPNDMRPFEGYDITILVDEDGASGGCKRAQRQLIAKGLRRYFADLNPPDDTSSLQDSCFGIMGDAMMGIEREIREIARAYRRGAGREGGCGLVVGCGVSCPGIGGAASALTTGLTCHAEPGRISKINLNPEYLKDDLEAFSTITHELGHMIGLEDEVSNNALPPSELARQNYRAEACAQYCNCFQPKCIKSRFSSMGQACARCRSNPDNTCGKKWGTKDTHNEAGLVLCHPQGNGLGEHSVCHTERRLLTLTCNNERVIGAESEPHTCCLPEECVPPNVTEVPCSRVVVPPEDCSNPPHCRRG